MNRTIHYILLAAIVCVTVSCSTTKRLGEGEVLYTGVKKMKIESIDGEKVPSAVKSAVKEPLSVKPNNPLFSPYVRTPIPTGLWAYNYLYTDKTKGFKSWLYRKFAKKPVLISDVRPDLRVQVVNNVLENLGYFHASADYEVIPNKRNEKKARINYHVEVPSAWFYNTVEFPVDSLPVTALIDSLQSSSKLHVGDQYNIDTLAAERVRITNILRNNRYYYFRPDYLEYLADSTEQNLMVDLQMVYSESVPPPALRPYRIGEITVTVSNPEGGEPDSLYHNGMKIRYQQPLKVKNKVWDERIVLRSGDPSVLDDQNLTLNNLTRLGIFRYVNMNVPPLDSLKGADSLNIEIVAALDSPLEAEFEADLTSKSNSFLGPGAIFSVKNKNKFHAGEVLSVRLNGSYEWQTGNRSEGANSTAVNSYELGITGSLMFPRLIAPKFIPRSKKYDSKSTLTFGGSVLNRPKFFTMVSANLSWSYDFQSSQYSFHTFTPARIIYNHMLRTTSDFDQVMDDNPALAESFRNQLIPSGAYTYTFNRGYGPYQRNRLIVQNTVTVAGNLTSGVLAAFGQDKPRQIFGNPFSQFAKDVLETKFYWYLGRTQTLATRLTVGGVYAYGNTKVAPYSEQFYIGGANSIRAFTIRSLGPGSYRPAAGDTHGYFDQTGEFKLEANLEYRFGIFTRLNGALFVDAGNIWLLRDDPDRPGGKLGHGNFWDQIALGTGAGIRYDITFLVIRLDLGIGIHTPYKNPEKPGYYNISKFKDGLGWHLAIGYPF